MPQNNTETIPVIKKEKCYQKYMLSHVSNCFTRKFKGFRQQKAGIRAKHKQGTLQQWMVAKFGVLCQQCGSTANQRSLHQRTHKDVQKVGKRSIHGHKEAESIMLSEGINRTGQHNTYDIVEY